MLINLVGEDDFKWRHFEAGGVGALLRVVVVVIRVVSAWSLLRAVRHGQRALPISRYQSPGFGSADFGAEDLLSRATACSSNGFRRFLQVGDWSGDGGRNFLASLLLFS